MSLIAHEWVLEDVELEFEDIEDLHHFETYAELRQHINLFPAPEGHRYDVAITRRRYDKQDPESLARLSYAYLDEDFKFPSHFQDGDFCKVPAKFQCEVTGYRLKVGA
jgi:hypothetical protein